ncbi:hypothetical protein [Neisseria yangbaofengii]|uniref:hypothetical protein n=1 Tax=Neisseria yangbaofengii TaxID=2709396 RepID=UPI0013EDF900|nr:hypothetical protein [Neisseria yangbaofengii]
MNKIYLSMFSLPVFIIIIIFILIGKNHKKNPDILSCKLFQKSLVKSVPLYVKKEEFDKGIKEICQCFRKNNIGGSPIKFVTKLNLDKCSKSYIYRWILSDNYEANVSNKNCIKNRLYEEVISPEILIDQKNTHKAGIFKNDLFNYKSRNNRNKSELISIIYMDCLKTKKLI